jgi:hypothetical protein
VIEFVLRQSLQNDHTYFTGSHPENGKKLTDTPAAERLLKAFPDGSLTIVKTATGEAGLFSAQFDAHVGAASAATDGMDRD